MARRKRRQFTPEFKAEAVRLARVGDRSIGQVAADLDLTETALREWVRRAEADEGKGSPETLTTAEREELTRLLDHEDFPSRDSGGVAGHSSQMDPLLSELRGALEGVKPQAARVPMRSTVRAAPVEGPELGADHWVDNLRRPVRFFETVRRRVSPSQRTAPLSLEDGAAVIVRGSRLIERLRASRPCRTGRAGRPEPGRTDPRG